MKLMTSYEPYTAQIERLKAALDDADAVIIGAGAGLSASAGFSYSGERFYRYFADFAEKYGIRDMYSGGFYPFPSAEEFWAWWSRQVYFNRYAVDAGKPYTDLLKLVGDKNYFVLTTNVDHQFQLAGFDKERLFYTQGDYGLFQCSVPCHQKTYDNEEAVTEMVARQENMRIPTELIPKCPVCGKPMSMNLRCDDTFVEDEGWHRANARYEAFLEQYKDKRLVLLELGVGGNTLVIIKYPFWQIALQNQNVTYACVNLGESACPEEIAPQSVCLDADIGKVLADLIR